MALDLCCSCGYFAGVGRPIGCLPLMTKEVGSNAKVKNETVVFFSIGMEDSSVMEIILNYKDYFFLVKHFYIFLTVK